MQLSDQWLDRMLAINTAGDQKVCKSKQESWKSWRVTWILHPSVFWAFIYLFLYISISRLFGQRASDGAAVFPIPVFLLSLVSVSLFSFHRFSLVSRSHTWICDIHVWYKYDPSKSNTNTIQSNNRTTAISTYTQQRHGLWMKTDFKMTPVLWFPQK